MTGDCKACPWGVPFCTFFKPAVLGKTLIFSASGSEPARSTSAMDRGCAAASELSVACAKSWRELGTKFAIIKKRLSASCKRIFRHGPTESHAVR